VPITILRAGRRSRAFFSAKFAAAAASPGAIFLFLTKRSRLSAEKNCAPGFGPRYAASLPQDLQVQRMFGAADFSDLCLSA
jgi:hypothetical protein